MTDNLRADCRCRVCGVPALMVFHSTGERSFEYHHRKIDGVHKPPCTIIAPDDATYTRWEDEDTAR